MVYRIRYIQARRQQQGEKVIEAHSPEEAMVKFHATRRSAGFNCKDIITSIWTEQQAYAAPQD